jgi:triosephosphate isomerase
LQAIGSLVRRAALGAQDYAPDLKPCGVRYVIVGHSDRRAQGDTDAVVAEKTALALYDGLIPILCVGETAHERAAGDTDLILKHQVRAGLLHIARRKSRGRFILSAAPALCIAYEPLWAISSHAGAHSATPHDALRAIAIAKEQLLHCMCGVSCRFLYGGSVTAGNIASFLREDEIDGVLVGAASTAPDSFLSIISAAYHLNGNTK